jgi:hypothetical protein
MNVKINFSAGNETLVGEIIGSNPEALGDVILFHGAGASTKERAAVFFDETVRRSVPAIVTFDFSGHGESSGDLRTGSLKQRVLEARAAIDSFTTRKNLTVCGSSMGGYVALKMLEFYDVKNIILFAPAVYDADAFGVRFDQGFSEIIRRPKSWENTDIIPLLRKFPGNLLLFIGANDEVIPDEVVGLIETNAKNAARKEIIRFDNCPHAIHTWLGSHDHERKYAAAKILSIIGG